MLFPNGVSNATHGFSTVCILGYFRLIYMLSNFEHFTLCFFVICYMCAILNQNTVYL